MTEMPLFSVTQADGMIIVTPQRNLAEFNFAQIESEAAPILGRFSKGFATNVVVDFSKIDYTGSTALGFFTRLFKIARCRGGEMAFCNVSPVERDILRITRLDTVWTVCDTLEDALQTVSRADRRSSSVTWVVIADRAVARIFERSAGPDDELQPVATLEHPESRQRVHDLVSDRPGSFRSRANSGLVSGEPHPDHRHHTAEEFSREVAGYLETARQRDRFEHLILVASPLFLGTLRDALSAPLSQLVEHELAKDYTHLDEATIRTHVSELTATA